MPPSGGILESILNVFWWSWGCFGDPGLPRGPEGGRVGKVTEKVVRGSFVGPPPGPPWEPKSTKNREKVVPRSTLENTVCKVLHKRCLGTPSNHENKGFVYTKPVFSNFLLDLQNNRKWCPKGTLWDAFGWFWEVLGTILGDEKIVAKIGFPKVTQKIREPPRGLRFTLVFL